MDAGQEVFVSPGQNALNVFADQEMIHPIGCCLYRSPTREVLSVHGDLEGHLNGDIPGPMFLKESAEKGSLFELFNRKAIDVGFDRRVTLPGAATTVFEGGKVVLLPSVHSGHSLLLMRPSGHRALLKKLSSMPDSARRDDLIMFYGKMAQEIDVAGACLFIPEVCFSNIKVDVPTSVFIWPERKGSIELLFLVI